nr:retrovirus-related Pol polyprotein from transposon TNT 1-94 [Tanacetum cinerariifolium]
MYYQQSKIVRLVVQLTIVEKLMMMKGTDKGIHLYCKGKDNEEYILQSIDEGPFKMGRFRETLGDSAEGALRLGLE